MTTPEPQYTILRIKRKITDDPLEALCPFMALLCHPFYYPFLPLLSLLSLVPCLLAPSPQRIFVVIDDASTSSSSSRPIKKSRSVLSNQPVVGSSRGIFRLAETVPEGWEPTKDGEALKVYPPNLPIHPSPPPISFKLTQTALRRCGRPESPNS
jgi:hypothetical protein